MNGAAVQHFADVGGVRHHPFLVALERVGAAMRHPDMILRVDGARR